MKSDSLRCVLPPSPPFDPNMIVYRGILLPPSPAPQSTKLDGRFAPAWIGFGNAFAAQEETDQAVSAYRTAARLFQGSHLALLYIGT